MAPARHGGLCIDAVERRLRLGAADIGGEGAAGEEGAV
jgi:hypothetical protein